VVEVRELEGRDRDELRTREGTDPVLDLAAEWPRDARGGMERPRRPAFHPCDRGEARVGIDHVRLADLGEDRCVREGTAVEVRTLERRAVAARPIAHRGELASAPCDRTAIPRRDDRIELDRVDEV